MEKKSVYIKIGIGVVVLLVGIVVFALGCAEIDRFSSSERTQVYVVSSSRSWFYPGNIYEGVALFMIGVGGMIGGILYIAACGAKLSSADDAGAGRQPARDMQGGYAGQQGYMQPPYAPPAQRPAPQAPPAQHYAAPAYPPQAPPYAPYGAPVQGQAPARPAAPYGAPAQAQMPPRPAQPYGAPAQGQMPPRPAQPYGAPVQGQAPARPAAPYGTPVQAQMPPRPAQPYGAPAQGQAPARPAAPAERPAPAPSAPATQPAGVTKETSAPPEE